MLCMKGAVVIYLLFQEEVSFLFIVYRMVRKFGLNSRRPNLQYVLLSGDQFLP